MNGIATTFMSVSERKAQRLRLPRLRELGRGGDPGAESGDEGQSPEYLVGAGRGQRRHPAPVRLSARSKLSRECEAWEAMCVGGLIQTDPQERAKTTTASSDCRPRPTAPDPVVSHGNSQMQAKAGPTNAGEATSTHHREWRAGARGKG